MLKQTIKFKTLDGEDRERDFYFHIKKDKLVELEIVHEGGFKDHLQDIIASKNGRKIMDAFKEIVAMSYGERSEDGLSFLQSPERSEWFMGTDAYSEFFFDLVTEPEFAAKFVNGIMPSNLEQEAAKLEAKMKRAGISTTDTPASARTFDKIPSAEEMASMSPEDMQEVMKQIREGKLKG